MSDWLSPLRSALSQAERPVTFFFRDDDAGWEDDRLRRLLDVFRAEAVPLDIAAIPRALSPTLCRLLADRHRAEPALVRVHQHGFAHENHEPSGRKCEFGPARAADAQLADIARGRKLLLERLDVTIDGIFTPPWNRCAQATVAAVRGAGLTVLSREANADALTCDGIAELPVSVDWLRRRRGVRISPYELGEALAAAARADAPVGVMLHHAVMDADDRDRVAQLLALLQRAPRVRLAAMRDLGPSEVFA